MNPRACRRCVVTASCLTLLLTSGTNQVRAHGSNKTIFVSVLDGKGQPLVTGIFPPK